MSKTFYITTPIYYPNGEPHLGHAYTTIATDVLARYHRLIGDETFFLTGTDEHGIKMVKTAAEKKIEPRALADQMVASFRNFWKEIGITNDDFIRTTEDRHKLAVQEIVRRLVAKDDIYLGSYEGWYDEGQEEFVTETEAKAAEFKSVISGRPLTRFSEKSYFFRLKKYAGQVQKLIEENPAFLQPEARRNEVLSKLKLGVEDLSISRATLKWGIPLPHDPEHVVYVWIDALSNYITALGYGSADDSLFEKFWPADVHVIGKEILWFHTVYWPAILISLGLPLPKKVFAHGWWTSAGRKMSKSLGNFIDLEKLRSIISTYSLDALRYYLLRAAPFGSDLDWTDGDFLKSFNELKNVVGNCLNRTIKMIGRYREGVLPAAGELAQIDQDLLAHGEKLPAQLAAAYDRVELQQCAELPVQLARLTNGYIDATEPFKLAKDPGKAKRLDTVLNVAARSIYRCLVGLLPILPDKGSEGLRQLQIESSGKTLDWLNVNPPAAGTKLGEGQPLFPNVVTDEKEKLKIVGESSQALQRHLEQRTPAVIDTCDTDDATKWDVFCGTLVEIGARLFLATASHTLERGASLSRYWLVGELRKSRNEERPKVVALNRTESESPDVGYLELDRASMQRFPDLSICPIERLKICGTGPTNRLTALVGTPGQLIQHGTDGTTKTLKVIGMSYTSVCLAPSDPIWAKAEPSSNAEIDVFMEYPKGQNLTTRSDNQQPYELPHPGGMSGGGLWDYQMTPNTLWAPGDASIYGIQSAWNETARYVRGVQIIHWIRLIHKDYPDLRKILEGHFAELKKK